VKFWEKDAEMANSFDGLLNTGFLVLKVLVERKNASQAAVDIGIRADRITFSLILPVGISIIPIIMSISSRTVCRVPLLTARTVLSPLVTVVPSLSTKDIF
jgi:hypothetical protein